MIYWHVLNIVRKILKLPIALMLAIIAFPLWCLITDWDDERDRRFTLQLMRSWIW